MASSIEGYADGIGKDAKFSGPFGITVDKNDNLYVADNYNSKIRKITPSGVVSTIAGGARGDADGTGSNAEFKNPTGICIDSQRNLYISETGSTRIRKITPSAVVSTFAGSSTGSLDRTGVNEKFSYPKGITIDAHNNLYVVDLNNSDIRKITPNGVVSTLGGNTLGFANGAGSNAQFKYPRDITIDTHGNLYVTDTDNHKIRKITPIGTVITIAGSTSGFKDGTGSNPKFDAPEGIAIDSQGNLYIVDTANHKIRKIIQE